MAITKIAVDQIAKDYWSKYFGDYGSQWVRDIPRRIKKALLDRKVVASAGAGASNSADVECSIIPLGHAVKADRVELDGVAKFANHSLLFCASFDHDGELQELETRDAPAAK